MYSATESMQVALIVPKGSMKSPAGHGQTLQGTNLAIWLCDYVQDKKRNTKPILDSIETPEMPINEFIVVCKVSGELLSGKGSDRSQQKQVFL